MKNILLLIITFIIFIACKKADNIDPSSLPEGTLSCTISGKNWVSDKDFATAQILNDGTVSIEGLESGTKSDINLGIFKVDMVAGKTIDIADNTSERGNAYYHTLDANFVVLKQFNGLSGQVNIISVSATNVTGTFTFEADSYPSKSEKVSITNGKFNLKIQ